MANEANNSTISREEFERRVIAKAWRDDAFRQELLRNPKATLEREFQQINPGAKLPNNLQITVLEEKPQTMYLVLPEHPNVYQGQNLSDEELEMVAGGMMANSNRITCGWTCIHDYTSTALSCAGKPS